MTPELCRLDRRRRPSPRNTILDRSFLFSPLFHRHKLANIMPNPHLPRPSDLLLRVSYHLLPLREPANGARNREQYGEHFRLEAHRLGNDAGKEIHIGIAHALNKIFVFQSNEIELQCDSKLVIWPGDLENALTNSLNNMN